MVRISFGFAAWGILLAWMACGPTAGFAAQPPQPGMAALPVSVAEENALFDPTWVSHRGQVILFLYVGAESAIPQETIDRVNDLQTRLSSRGFQAVVMTEADGYPDGLNSDVIVVQDAGGETRQRFGITDEREYFLVDRYGRLRRQRIRPSFIEKALSENFDPAWVGYSSSWNQCYYVLRGEHLMYLVDTIPDTARPGDRIDVRVIALPTYSEEKKGASIFSPIQIEVSGDPFVFEKNVYRTELKEEVRVSTELLLEVQVRADAEPGFQVLRVQVQHSHCGIGNCGGFKQRIPIPIWVE